MPTDFSFTFPYVYKNGVIALGAALPIACIIIVALRFSARRAWLIKLGADDWLALCALVPVVGMGACLITGVHFKAMGYPTPAPPSDLTQEQLADYVDPTTRVNEIIEFPFQILLVLAYGLIKSSILLSYQRIFVVHKNSSVNVLLIIAITVIVLWTFTFEMLVVFACGRHLWANWGSTNSQLQYCPVAFTSEYGLVISDLILDVFVFLIPVPLVWRLHMTTKRKIQVIGVFLLAASAVGASIARLALYVQILKALVAEGTFDTNLASTVGYFWSLLEAGLTLISACLPYLANLLRNREQSSILSSDASSQYPGTLRRTNKSENQSDDSLKEATNSDARRNVSIAVGMLAESKH